MRALDLAHLGRAGAAVPAPKAARQRSTFRRFVQCQRWDWGRREFLGLAESFAGRRAASRREPARIGCRPAGTKEPGRTLSPSNDRWGRPRRGAPISTPPTEARGAESRPAVEARGGGVGRGSAPPPRASLPPASDRGRGGPPSPFHASVCASANAGAGGAAQGPVVQPPPIGGRQRCSGLQGMRCCALCAPLGSGEGP